MNTAKLTKDDVILVTGGTGFTGIHLVKKLCETGAEVRVLARASSKREELNALPIIWCTGDVFDEEVVKQAVKGVNYIFHVAAAFREAKIADKVYWNVHVKSTQLLTAAAMEQPDFRRFVHVSTMGVHGHIDNPPADENYRFAPGDEYQRTKVEAEEWVKGFAKESGLPLTVVRPCAIYGPGDRRLLKIFKMAKLPVCPILGMNSKGLYHLIHVNDLVNFMMVAATHEKTLGEVYLCGNETAISFTDMVQLIGKKLGRVPPMMRLPVTPFFIAGDICEAICKPLGIEPPIYRRRVAFFTKDRSFNTEKMRNDTGFEYEYDNESGLLHLADWYAKQGWL